MTRDTLNKLHELTAKVHEAKEHASELLRIAQDRFKHRTHTIKRAEKDIELKEHTLWEEVFHLGTKCDAALILQEHHPEVFEAYEKQEAAAVELRTFCLAELGLDYTQLTLSDYLRMTEELFALMQSEGTRVPVRVAPNPEQATEPPSVDLSNPQAHRV